MHGCAGSAGRADRARAFGDRAAERRTRRPCSRTRPTTTACSRKRERERRKRRRARRRSSRRSRAPQGCSPTTGSWELVSPAEKHGATVERDQPRRGADPGLGGRRRDRVDGERAGHERTGRQPSPRTRAGDLHARRGQAGGPRRTSRPRTTRAKATRRRGDRVPRLLARSLARARQPQMPANRWKTRRWRRKRAKRRSIGATTRRGEYDPLVTRRRRHRGHAVRRQARIRGRQRRTEACRLRIGSASACRRR